MRVILAITLMAFPVTATAESLLDQAVRLGLAQQATPHVIQSQSDPVWTWGTVAFVAAQTADLVTTLDALAGDRGREVNPLVAPLSGHPVAFSALKVGVAGVAWVLLRYAHQRRHGVAKWALWGSAIGTSAVAVHNAGVGR